LQNYNKKDSGESRCGVGKLSTRAIRRKSGLAMSKRKKKKKECMITYQVVVIKAERCPSNNSIEAIM
jgi:hypothetical protein